MPLLRAHFDGVGSSATEPMTRNQVAQMVLNTLKSGMVQPDGNTLNYFDTTGQVIATSGKVNYVYVTSNKPFAKAISGTAATSMGSVNSDPIVELGEQLYNGELKLYGEGGSIADRVWDVFGRPARRWEYQGQEIGTYEKKELTKETYTAKVTGQTLYDLLGKSTIDTYNFRITIDGVKAVDDIYGADANAAAILGGAMFSQNDMYRNNKDAVGRTGNGVLTQVYIDTDFTKNNSNTNDYWVYISIINTYLAKATEDYDAKNDDVNLRVWRLDRQYGEYVKSSVENNDADRTRRPTDYREMDAKGEDFEIVKDVKKDDLYKVTVADGEIQTIETPEILSAVTIDAFKLFDHVTTGGQQYDHTTTARYDVEAIEDWTGVNGSLNLKELTYNVVLDDYGYLIGLERNEDPNQYVFVTGIENAASNLYAKQVDANVIHLDGTMETIKVDMTKSTWGQPGPTYTDQSLRTNYLGNLSQINTWCTYTVSTSGVYTLKRVAVASGTNIFDDTTVNTTIGQYAQDVNRANDNETVNVGGTPWYTKSINTKRVSLKAADNSSYVYGNDDTVYLAVSLENVVVDDDTDHLTWNKDKGGAGVGGYDAEEVGVNRWIIDDVDAIITGVKNANLKAVDNGMTSVKNAKTYGYPDAEIYTLFDDDGIVIAAVVIGEDDGASSTYAYIHSSGLEEESYNGTAATRAENGEWTWTRKAIVNGVETLLKEVGDSPKYLSNKPVGDWAGMTQGRWYEIRYNADGNVRRAELVSNVPGDDKYPSEVQGVEHAVNESETVVLRDNTTVNALSYKNGTLYTNKDQTKGFSVDPDVKTVLILAGKQNSGSATKYNTKLFDSTTDGYNGYTGLEQALREVNYKATDVTPDFQELEVSAILENGRATTIIINDYTYAPDQRPDGGNKPASGSNVIYNINDYRNVTFYKGATLVVDDDITAAGVGTRKFEVAKDVTVSLYGTAGLFGSKAGTAPIGDITFTVNANGDTASFTMPNANVTLPSPAAIKAEVDKEGPAPDDDVPAAVAGVKVAISGTDTYSSTQTLKVGYFGVDAPNLNQVLQAVGNYILTEVPNAKSYDVAITAANTYSWTVKNNLGVTIVTLSLDVSSNVVEGLRVRYVDAAGAASAGSGYEIVADASNVSKYVGNTLYIQQNGKYTKARATASGDWTWSEELGVSSNDFSTDALKKSAVAITGHDWQVNLSTATAKVTIDNDTYYGVAGTTKIAGTAAEVASGAAAIATTDRKAGTSIETIASDGTTVAHVAYSAATTMTAGMTYNTGYIAIADTNVSSASVGGKAVTKDGSTYYVPASSTVAMVISGTDGQIFQAADADGNVGNRLTLSGTTGNLEITVNSKDVTVSVVKRLAANTLGGVGAGTAAPNAEDVTAFDVVWQYRTSGGSWQTIDTTADFYYAGAPADQFRAVVTLNKNYTDQGGQTTAADDELAGGTGATAASLLTGVTCTSATAKLDKGGVTKDTDPIYFTWAGNANTSGLTLTLTAKGV